MYLRKIFLAAFNPCSVCLLVHIFCLVWLCCSSRIFLFSLQVMASVTVAGVTARRAGPGRSASILCPAPCLWRAARGSVAERPICPASDEVAALSDPLVCCHGYRSAAGLHFVFFSRYISANFLHFSHLKSILKTRSNGEVSEVKSELTSSHAVWRTYIKEAVMS